MVPALIMLYIASLPLATLPPAHLTRHGFLHSIIPLEKLLKDIYFNRASFAKIIIICENDYSPENN